MPKEKTLTELKKMKDKDIDFSDIPELDDAFLENAEWVKPDKTLDTPISTGASRN